MNEGTHRSAAPDSATATNVVDAGCRYGIHPTWVGFSGELRYFMFEADTDEAERLERKYAGDSRVTVVAKALGEKLGVLTMNQMRHHGLSTALEPNAENICFTTIHREEGRIIGKFSVPMTSLDDYCSENGVACHFVKTHTEGYDYQILKGARQQLISNVLGLRSEVSFDHVYKDVPLFGVIHDYLMECGFFLLNLEYDGRGQPRNAFVENNRHGTLICTNGIWLKRESFLFAQASTAPEKTAADVLRYAAFCLNNGGSDVAIDVLQTARKKHGLDFSAVGNTALLNFVKIAVLHLFKRLSGHPAYATAALGQVYEEIFAERMKTMHEFFESDTLNPI